MLTEIARFHDPIAAEIARGALVAAGIDAVLLDRAASAAYAGALLPSRLMVEERDAAAARALIGAAQP